MKKTQKFVKITKVHVIITIHFETLKSCRSQVSLLRKSSKFCHFGESGIGRSIIWAYFGKDFSDLTHQAKTKSLQPTVSHF